MCVQRGTLDALCSLLRALEPHTSRTLVLGPGTAGLRVRSRCRAHGAESGYLTRRVWTPRYVTREVQGVGSL